MSSLLPNSRTASEHSTPLSRRNETAAKPLARSNSIGSATSPSRLLRSTVMPSANRRPNKAGGGTQHTRVRGNADEDLVGERILELLRACEMSHHQDKESQKQGFRWRPLVSRHNWNALRNSAQQGFFTKQGIQSTGWGVVSAARRFLVNEHRPTRWSSILFFWRVIAFSLLALTAASVCLLVWSAHVLGVVVRSLAVVLVDWDELSRNRYYQTLTARAVQVYRAVDSAILQGRRFEGRSWNKDGYIFWSTTSTLLDKAANRDFTLWEIPPPKEKPLTKWSSRTLQHIYAIDYCYAMLAMEHLHRQNKQSRGQDEMSKLSKLPLSDDGDANNNMQIIRQDKGWHTDTSGVDRDFNNGMFENNQVAVVPEYPYVASENLAVVPDASRGAIEVQMLSSSRPLERCADGNMDWIDVGARIGMRLLNSEHIQRAMASQDTKDRIMETMGNVDPQKPDFPDKSDLQPNSTSEPRKRLSKPIHSMWTSPEAAALRGPTASMNSYMEHEDLLNLTNLYNLPIRQSHTFPASPLSDRPSLPTVSPRNSPKRIISDPVPKNPCNTQIRDYKGQNTSPLVADRDLGCPGPSVASLPPHINIISLPEAHDNSIEEPVNAGGFTCISLNKRCCGTALASSKGYRSASHVKGHVFRRTPLQPGVKVAIPLFPVQPRNVRAPQHSSYQMTTVVSSCRIYVDDLDSSPKRETNCLSVTVKLDKFFLRNGEFGELTFRVMDEWSPRYMPRHSKVAIGSCVATSFGIGVLVGWRVEDDCHVVRSLWRCRGPGSSHAYMNRQAIHSTTAAAVGFRVQTLFGWGIVLACVNGGRTFDSCRFFVEIREDCQHKGDVLELDKKEILSCHGAQFMPVIEHVREAALYQIQLDNYNAALREQILQEDTPTMEQELLRSWSACADILWNSFLKAVEEDKAFDDGVNDFMTSIITFLDRLDENDGIEDDLNKNLHDVKKSEQRRVPVESSEEIEVQLTPTEGDESTDGDDTQEPGFWIMNHLFGGLFKTNDDQGDRLGDASPIVKTEAQRKPSYYDRAFAVLRTLMKTVSLARAASVEHPHFRLALAITYDFLLFVRTIVKVQERNTSVHSLKVWKRAWEEIVSTFGPIKERLESIGRGIAYRMEHQGRRAKVRVLKFVDKILGDERLLFALEQGEWDRCLARLEIALVEAEVIKEENLSYYRKAAKFVYDHVQMSMGGDGGAATRNSEKLALLARFIQSLASPRRSVLKIFCRDDMLELFERILVRAYYKEEVATRMLTIHAANFHTLRHLRMLKDFSVAGRIWIPLLDAADEEFSWLVSTLPENSKEFMCPLSSLFSLCVSQFHKINAGDLSKDWLAFLLEEESARIINDIDMLLILSLEAFSRDIREMMTVLPYYPSIDDDILHLMDEVNVDEFLREASNAIDDPDQLSQYIREKTTIAIERFLNYLPKMSIPVEKRELGDGWVLSCNGQGGGGLTLSDVTIKRENLVCQIMGGDTLFFPMFADDSKPEPAIRVGASLKEGPLPPPLQTYQDEEESILDHIRELIVNAQKYGCWTVGVGGVNQPPTDRYAASVFHGLPVSNVLNCSIGLWRNLEIDDDELLEIAIRDISYHIQLQKEREERFDTKVENPCEEHCPATTSLSESTSFGSQINRMLTSSCSFEGQHHRFNPRVDPTVLFLEIKRLTLHLDNFFFRIEKGEKKTIFDPVFAGRGMLSLQNVSIRLRVECAKERVKKVGLGIDISTPILQLRDMEVKLDKLQMTVKDTGFGSDWILNKAVEVFEDQLTEVVESNLKDQIREQAQNAIENLNSYFLINPSLLLNLLGISMEDLDDNVVWV